MKGGRIVISFIPVIHRGYLDFLKKAGTKSVCVIEASDVPEVPHLARELRALTFEEVQKVLAPLGFRTMRFSKAREVIEDRGPEVTLIMPDEDISHVLHKKYLQGMKVEFVGTFLRWDWNRTVATATTVPAADRVIRKGSVEMGDIAPRMSLLLKTREKSSDWWRQIAAMAVCKDGTTIMAFNCHLPNEYVPYIDGDPRNNFGPGEYVDIYTSLHAEKGIVVHAAREGIKFKGSDVFVTTFPCSNCANDLVAAGVKRVFFSGGYSNLNGVKTLRDHGVELIYVEM